MIEEGVYIFEGSFRTGTGITAGSQQTSRSLWATCAVFEDSATLMLLDEKGQPTGLVETVSRGQLKARYHFQPLSAKTWGVLRARVQTAYRPRAANNATPAPPGPQAESAPPEGRGQAKPASEDPYDTTPWWKQGSK